MIHLFLRLLVALLIFVPPIAASADGDLTANLRLGAESAPLATAYDCVNLISGDFFLSDTAASVDGEDALRYTRYYDSGDGKDRGRGRGFGLELPLKLGHLHYSPVAKEPCYTLAVEEREDASIEYRGSNTGNIIEATVKPTIFSKYGYTNYAATDNVRARKLSFAGWKCETSGRVYEEFGEDKLSITYKYTEGQCLVTLGSGATRIYSWLPQHSKTRWFLTQEIKPNGHKILFEYGPKGQLTQMRTTNAAETLTFNRICITDLDNAFQVSASNGQSTLYHTPIKPCKIGGSPSSHRFLQGIHPSHGPDVGLAYQYKLDKENGSGFKLRKIGKPEGRQLEIDYDGNGKVNRLSSCLGQDSTLIPMAHFLYEPSRTFVYDALGNLLIYNISSKRIDSIDRCNAVKERHSIFGASVEVLRYKLYASLCYFWGNQEPQTGNLLATGLANANKDFIQCSVGTYDDRGNLTKEELYGNLSGLGPDLFQLGPDHRPTSPVECFTHTTHYSTDGFNLPLHEEWADGKVCTYGYLQNTNLLTSKLVGNGTTILQREFRSYSPDNLLTLVLIDDGCGATADDLTGVTCRKFIATSPRLTAPAVGAPDHIVEGYIDLTTHQQTQLKRTAFTYNDQELVVRQEIYDANDHFAYALEFGYDNKRNLISQTDALGQITLFSYDVNQNKTREELIGSGFYTTFSYDFSDRLIKREEMHSDGNHFSTSYRYDYLNRKIAEIDFYGNETRYVYDSFGREIERTNASGTIQKEYNLLNQLTAVVDQNKNRTTKTYTIRNAPVCVSYPDGTQENHQYNLNGTLAIKKDSTGLQHHYTYDALDRVIRTDSYDTLDNLQYTLNREYLGAHLIRESDPMGYITEYAYDGAGRKISETKQGAKTTSSYDALGRLATTKQWFGLAGDDYIAYVQTYDHLDRSIEIRAEDSKSKVLRKETYSYDRLGNRVATAVYDSETTLATTETHFNSRGLPIAQIDALGNLTRIDYNHAFINADQQRVLQKTTTDALGNIQQETFDILHRLVKIERRNAFGVMTALQQFNYDAVGNKILQRETVLIDGQPSHDYVICWEHDSMGRVVNTTESGGDDAVKTTLQLYDQYGRLLEITKPDSVTLRHTYDPLGRLETLISSDQTVSYRYHYDLNSNPTCVEDQLTGQLTCRHYDAWNRLINETLANGLAFAYSYDHLGRLTQLQLPDHSTITYGYDAAHLREVSREDSNGCSLYQHLYSKHDLRGCELEAQLIGRAGTRQCAWDALGRNTRIQTNTYQEEIPVNGYDAIGNLLCRYTKDSLGDLTNRYRYNDLKQLVSEEGSVCHSYDYDSIDNRLKKDSACYSVSRLNQVINDSEASYRYDLNGNLVAKVLGDQETRLTYDALNRLRSAESPGSFSAHYTYDSFGRRLTKTCGETAHSYLYQGMREIGAVQDGDIIQLRVLGTGKGAELGAAIALELNGKTYAPVHDHRGNICCLIDINTGEVAATYRYSAFGEAIIHGIVDNPWGFASKRLDSETGFLHFSKRYYSPHLGRWITPDPLGFADGPNLYAYVHNSPLSLIDPWGLSSSDNWKTGNDFSSRNNWNGRDHNRQDYGERASFQPSTWGLALFGILGLFADDEIVRDRGAYIAHESLRAASSAASVIPQVMQFACDVAPLPSPNNGSNLVENFESLVGNGHESIDQLFSTNQAQHYTPEAIAIKEGSLTLGMLPGPMTVASWIKGWRLGCPINNLTRVGNIPSWNAVRQRYWKNQAKSCPDLYPGQVDRMKRGLAPQRFNKNTRGWESKELHHVPAQKDGGKFDFIEVWPDEHADLDKFRRIRI